MQMFCFVQTLGAQLAETKDKTKMTKDILPSQSVALNRNKYKTMKQIRQGNISQWIEMFETM